MRRLSKSRWQGSVPFQFTHPGRGATKIINAKSFTPRVSIHAPREGCDVGACIDFVPLLAFQFTHPGRGATYLHRRHPPYARGFNSRTPGGVRLPTGGRPPPHQGGFNSRTPGGVRRFTAKNYNEQQSFNSRTPGGVRRSVDSEPSNLTEFQFTHPGRGATDSIWYGRADCTVSIHAPREGCDLSNTLIDDTQGVSIHAPREGCDSQS